LVAALIAGRGAALAWLRVRLVGSLDLVCICCVLELSCGGVRAVGVGDTRLWVEKVRTESSCRML
jgi:hypothetical protein